MSFSASTLVAGVAGSPINHSLSPLLHNAWIATSGLDAVYLAFEPREFGAFVTGLRGGVIRGLNVTAPFKEQALALADVVSESAARAAAANLMTFEKDGRIIADNTDGEGLLAALSEQTIGFDPKAGPAVVLGAGGAARGAVAALVGAGAPIVRIVNRSPDKAKALAASFSGVAEAISLVAVGDVLADANLVVNATSAHVAVPLELTARTTVVMDMVYRPLMTPFLAHAHRRGLQTVDGLAMLIGQARPSFERLFGAPPPPIDVREMAISNLAAGP